MLPISQPLKDCFGKAMRVLKIGKVLGSRNGSSREIPITAPRRTPRYWPPEHLICVDEQRRALHGEFEPAQRNHSSA